MIPLQAYVKNVTEREGRIHVGIPADFENGGKAAALKDQITGAMAALHLAVKPTAAVLPSLCHRAF